MANGLRRWTAPRPFLLFVLMLAVFQARGVRVGQCPDFPRELSQNCPPHSTIDQCKYDEDCTENNQQKCCKIGCGKICLNPSDGYSVCPVLPRPSPCPNEPNQCIDKSECGAGRECCSDGCRMICVEPVAIPTTKAVKTVPWKSCNATVDLAFIVDSSGSIARRNYGKIKAFVKYIAKSFGISPTGSRAGLVLYSTTASVKAHFGQYLTEEEFDKMVDGLPHERGLTYIDKALRLAASDLFPRARKNVPKIAMLLTDGEQTDPDGTINLRYASAPLRQQGVRLIAFGVGKSINVRELRLAVERDEDVVRVMKFDDLITKVRNYTASLCQAAETEPIHPDADVIFLIDSSSGVTTDQFDMQKQFVRRMARYFIISPLGPRAAFITYGSRSYTVISFYGYSSVADFSLKINNARFLGGTRRIDQALNHATKMFRETSRVGLRIVILLTAGNYYTGPGASSMSSVMMPLRSLDTHLYVIGIGSQFTPWMFTQMVRGPKDIFKVPSFSDLASWQSRIARQLRLSTNAFNYEPAYFNSDVIFLMDSSQYVSANNYILEKNFVKLMARLLNLANNRSRAALYAFSDQPQLQITFDGYEDREAFDAAVNNAPHLQNSRRIDRAFDAAAQLLRTKSRPSVPKYVILLTTGLQSRSADSRSLDITSGLIRSYGGRVFVVAILTGGYSIRDFYPAVQRPGDAFPVASFGDLLPRAPTIASRIMASWRAPNVPSFAADVAFVLDSSSGVTPFQYSRAKRFVRILSEYLNISPGKSRGSLVTFGETPVAVFGFDAYNTQTEFKNKVTDAPYLGGEPSVSSALRTAGTLFSDARGSYPWIAILVTPWRPNDIRDTKILEAAARPLLNRGVWLYVVSIGQSPYVGWLRPMVVQPRDAFSVVSYRDLPASIGPVASYITSDNYFYGSSTFQLDTIFLMDTSTGVDQNNFKIEKRFVQRIAMHLGVFHGKSRAALVAYGANASVIFSFGGYSSNAEFLRRLNEAPSFGGERRVDRALDTAAALLLGSRSNMPKAVVLFMAGKQSDAVDSIPIKEAARPLHQLGAWIYVMAIGQTDFSELQEVTIRPTDTFFMRSFSGLYGYIAPVARYVANTSVIAGTSNLNADIVFIIDGSSDVPYREYGTQKAFVRSLAQYLNVQPGHTRLALIAYGSRAMPVLRFDSSRTIVRFYSELTKAPYLGGERRVDTALGIATRIFGNARENVPKIVLLFMAGKQSRAPGVRTLQDSVKPLQKQGVRTFIFRVGSEPGIRELHSAVDRPENVLTFANYAELDARVPYVARHIPFYSGPLSLAVDVVYLLDSSNNVTSQVYDAQKSFVKQLSRYLNTMPSRTRGAVITFGSTATVITNFGDTSTTQEFHNAITNAPKVGGPRRMDSAIDSARNVFAKARPAVPKVVILLTTGDQAAGTQAGVLDTSFEKLYDVGARLYAVTISPWFVILPLRGSTGSNWFPLRSYISLPIYVMPLARHVSYDTAALGPYDFVADVTFMLDSSSLVTPEDYVKEKEFVKLIARYLNITPGKSRGSVVFFGTNAIPLLPFDAYSTMHDFNLIIDKAPQMGGKRRIDRAFGAAATLLQNARPSARKIAILLTGGRQSPEGGSLEDAMQLMRNRDVTTHVISIGDRSDVPVQRPEDLFYMTSYSDLPRQVQPIAKNITEPRVATPAPTTPAPTTPADPCKTDGCNAPYNVGCRAVDNKAQCICPTCPNILRPVCASDDVQDPSECNMRRYSCQGNTNISVAKQGPCDKECSAVVDIAFIIDSSGSIGRTNWERVKRFLKSLVSKLDVSASATRIAAISYSNNPLVVLRFNSFQGTDQANQVFDGMGWQRGFTYTDKALLLADRDLFQISNGMRGSHVPKIAFVITDGKQTTTSSYTRLSVASQGIKNKGVIVYALGVGSGADRAELEEIASRPDLVPISPSFDDLLSLSSGIRQRFCSVPTQAPTVTTTAPDPCVTDGCHAPFNLGCRVVDNKAQCICPTCPNTRRPVCASDGVQDLSECYLRQQACQGNVTITVAKQGQCDKECSTVVDIAFIIDSSGSIGRTNWERMKRFVKSVVSKLDVSPSATHVAAVAYSNNPVVVFRFNAVQGTDEINRELDGMRWQRGFTYTDKALLLADRDLFQTSTGMRTNVPKMAVVITDGKQTKTSSYTELSVASRGMKNKGVIVYAIGVGIGADRGELEEIASGTEYVHISASFTDLKNLAPRMRKSMCEVPTVAPPVTTPSKPDVCETQGCSAPYNIGCKVVEHKPQCICPTCPNIRRPVCASDDVQDLSECHLRQQVCLGDIDVTIAKQSQCDKECRSKLDIAFIIDSSGSIGRSNWERMKRFVKALISKLDVSPSATHVAAVAYSNNPVVVARFNYYQGTDHVNRVIDNMRWQRGYTYTDKALQLADRDVFQASNGMRADVPKLAVVITDGNQTKTSSYTKLSEASRGIKNKDVTVYAVGVGRQVGLSELQEIASGSEYVYTPSSFKDLPNIASGIRKRFCEAASPPTTTVTPIPTTSDPCVVYGCNAPHNIGCRVVDNKAQCICPTCPNTLKPVCASDDVQDLSECHLRQQACQGNITVTVAKQGPCDKECSTVVDIAFIIDSSGSIGRSNWERMKRFLKSLVSKLDVSPSATHVAAISYSNNPVVVFRFNSFQGTVQVNQLLDRMGWQRGFTYTDKALLLANSNLFQTSTGMRLNVPRLALVITDGKQTTTLPYTRLSEASRGMKNKGVIVYALGVGSGADRAELEEIASGPEKVFTSSSFKDLQNIATRITRRFCEVSTQTTTVTPSPTTPDPCQTQGCRAPYSIGCRVVDNKAQCICPTCPGTRRPVCASDGVQDWSECHLRQQACQGDITVTVAKQGPCDKLCSAIVDIAFIIDSSGSIGRTNWERMKRFVKSLVSKLDVSPSATHVAAVAYSNYPVVVTRFNGVQGTDEVNQVVDGMRWQRGFTYTDKALLLADRDVFQTSTGMRSSVPKLAIVITDGKQTTTSSYTRLSVASQGIKNKGVIVYALGVGSGADRAELEEIASRPDYVFMSSSFRNLQIIAPAITRRFCEATTEAPRVTTTQVTTPTPTTTDPKTKYSADVLFVMDSSRETASTYNTVKDFVKSLARYFNIEPKGTRAGLVVFNGKASVISDFENFRSASEFESTVDSVPHYGGSRSVSDALRTAAVVFPRSPSSVSRIVFLVTSGNSLQEDDGKSLGDVIDKLNTLGVRTYIALIGQSPNMQDFTSSVQNPENVFAIASRSEIPKQINQVGSYVLTDSATPRKLNLTLYILFVIDSSAEVSPSSFTQEKEFVKSLIEQLNIYPADSGSRVGIMVYSDGVTMVLNFQNQETKSGLETIVDNLPHLRGARRIDRALKEATGALRDLDSDVPKFVVLVAGGRQTDGQGTQTFSAAVKPLHDTGTITKVLAVGDDMDPSDFQAEDKNKSNVISVPSFSDLPREAARLSTDLLVDYVAPPESETGTPIPTTAEEITPTEQATTESIQTTTVKDGVWGAWRDWTRCSRTCGTGTQERLRSCVRPVCVGSSRETRSCQERPCPEHGGWGPWGGWSTCTKTCGSGTQTQERRCDSPRPEHGGRQCEGPWQQSRACNTENCPGATPSPVDIVFLLDTSNGVTQSDMRLQKEFTKLLGKLFNVAPSASHAAVLSYSDRTRLIGGFYDHLMGKTFDGIVDSVTLTGGRRNIEEALKQTQRLLTSARPTVPYVVFLITYGQQARELGTRRLTEMAQSVRDAGASLYVIGVGVDGNDPQLKPIVTRPADFFEIPSSSDLSSSLPSIGYYVVSRNDATTPRDYQAEVIYVVDSSSFVGPENYKTEKDFVKTLARLLNHSPTHTQSSVIIFDSFPETPIRMGSYRELGRFSEEVDNLWYLGGPSSQLGFALTFAARGFSTNRPDVPKIIIVLTNKDSPNAGGMDSLGGTLRREGKIVNVIAVGNEVNFPNLRRLVAQPGDMFTPKTYDNMMSFVPSVASNILALTTTPTTAPATTTQISTTVPVDVTTPSPQTTPQEETTVPTTPPEVTTSPPQTTTLAITTPREVTTPLPITTASIPTTPPVQPNKPGTCPYIPRPSSCSSQPKECNIDIDCSGDLKCCDNGCGKICVSRDYTPPPVDALDKCPPYQPNRQCSNSVQDECTCDSDCDKDDGYKCCFDGCRRLCRKKAGRECTAKVDIIYLMDASGSMSSSDFEKQKDFVSDLARIFRIGPAASHAAVVTYNDYPTVHSNFGDFDSTKEFAQAVYSINQTRGRTRIDRALVKTSDMFKSARKGIPKVLIALTDGGQTPDPDAIALDVASQLLRDQNVRVFALGVGHRINVTQLRSMVESNSDVFLVDSFEDLLRQSQTIAEKACKEIVTPCIQGVDIAFLMDSSESITDEDFEREKTAVKEIARKFLKASPDSRAGVIMYSGQPELSIDFTSQNALDKFQSAVDALPHKRSMTRIDLPLRFAAETLFLNPRPSVSSIAVVLTDGIQTPGPNVEPLGQAVLPLRSKGVRVLAVGVGPRVNRDELKDLVTNQDDVFQMSSFQELLDKSDQLLKAVCPHPTLPVVITSTTAATTTTATVPTTWTTARSTTPKATTTRQSTTQEITTTAITTEPPPNCDELFDVVFVMDSSRSIEPPQYEQEKNFVKTLARIFNVGAGSRAAVIVYSDDTLLEITFGQHRNLNNFLSAVDRLPYLQRRTRIDKALAVASEVLKQARPGFPKAVIVMTDGRQTRDPDAVALDIAADPIHRQGARVLVIGIGTEISQNELELIAKDPSDVFKVQSFDSLREAVRDVAASACIIKPVITTTAPDKRISTTTGPLPYCPTVTDPPIGSCSSLVSTCFSDEQCSSGFRCCFDGCRYTCINLSVGNITGPTTPLIPTSPSCAQAFDLGIAMDSSGSIRDANYQRERNFIKGLADRLVVGPQNVHLGLIVFSDVPFISIRFGTLKSTDRASFAAAVDSVPYLRGRTRIDSALQTANNNLFPDGRQNLAPQVFLLITDGRQSNDPGAIELIDAVKPLRDQGIKVIVVGIGSDVDEDELKSIVENPAEDLFLVASFLDLRPLLDNKKMTDAFCFPTQGHLRRNRS